MLSSPKENPASVLLLSVYRGRGGGRGKEGTKKEKKRKEKESRCDAMHPDGWLRRRSTRFHGIKDSALNPRDCREARGCTEGRREGKKDKERERERDRASARSERGQWSRRGWRRGAGRVLGFWVRSATKFGGRLLCATNVEQ